MQPIDLGDNFLKELKLDGLSDDQKTVFLHHIIEVLQLRVGTVLAESLTDEQAEDFDKLDEHDHHAAWAWLEQHCPQYKDVVASELEKLKRELINSTQKILS
jgi:hypothetical protein